MEGYKKDHNTKESGIALVTALIITLLTLMLIAGINFIIIRGFNSATINREFATAQDAAEGGAEYSTDVIKAIATAGTVPANMGADAATALNVIYYCNAGATNINVKTADGAYTINAQVTCNKSNPLGEGGGLVFPPPPGRGNAPPSIYCFYSIISQATGPENTIGKVEAVYRYAR